MLHGTRHRLPRFAYCPILSRILHIHTVQEIKGNREIVILTSHSSISTQMPDSSTVNRSYDNFENHTTMSEGNCSIKSDTSSSVSTSLLRPPLDAVPPRKLQTIFFGQTADVECREGVRDAQLRPPAVYVRWVCSSRNSSPRERHPRECQCRQHVGRQTSASSSDSLPHSIAHASTTCSFGTQLALAKQNNQRSQFASLSCRDSSHIPCSSSVREPPKSSCIVLVRMFQSQIICELKSHPTKDHRNWGKKHTKAAPLLPSLQKSIKATSSSWAMLIGESTRVDRFVQVTKKVSQTNETPVYCGTTGIRRVSCLLVVSRHRVGELSNESQNVVNGTGVLYSHYQRQ